MSDAKTFIDNFLQHYESQFYDPVKAHKYYEENKKLKGREKKLNKKQEAAWEFAKGNIAKAKTKELDTASVNNAKAMAMLRENATNKRKVISKKLSELIAKISKDRSGEFDKLGDFRSKTLEASSKALKARLEKIAKEADDKIAGLPPIPDGVSKEERTKLATERREKIAKIRGDAFTQRKTVSDDFSKKNKEFVDTIQTKRAAVADDANKKKDVGSDSSAKTREAVANELRGGIEKARSNYQALKEGLKVKYQQKSDQEREAISRSKF